MGGDGWGGGGGRGGAVQKQAAFNRQLDQYLSVQYGQSSVLACWCFSKSACVLACSYSGKPAGVLAYWYHGKPAGVLACWCHSKPAGVFPCWCHGKHADFMASLLVFWQQLPRQLTYTPSPT